MPKHHFLALDFGAESGRAILGTLIERETLELKEIHRFSTGQLPIQKHYFWNIYRFYEEVLKALQICADHNLIPESIGVDTWGVDFGLIGKDGSILRIPYTYRDPMTETSMPAFLDKMGRDEIYNLTGIALHKFNTIYQLYAMKMAEDPLLDIADKLLFMPDLLNYLLTGEAKSEFTFATTSQLFNPLKKQWDEDIIQALGIPVKLLPEVIYPGTEVGLLNQNISREIDVEGIKVTAVTSHDTASAIAAVPAMGDDDWAYISSGTWSLMGVENKEPIIDQRSMLFNFTNEGGAEGTFRFLKNIMGLWLLQESRRSWRKTTRKMEYSEIVELASRAQPFTALIDPDYPGFYNPLDMPAAIDTFCRQSNQVSPRDIGSIARTILESLALKYRMVLEQLELVAGRKINVIHIIGGGTQNELLSQFTANATGRKVVSGPVEATATGNLLMQALGLGYIDSLGSLRKVVRNSFDLHEYEPKDPEIWEEAYKRFQKIAKQN